jgi:hypothetical protein
VRTACLRYCIVLGTVKGLTIPRSGIVQVRAHSRIQRSLLVRERVRLALADLTRELVAAERSRTRSRSLSLA